jgi:hypothetical protein
MELNYIERFSSHRAVNTLRLGYKNQLEIPGRNSIAVSSKNHTKHINALCGQNVEVFFMLNLVAHKVATEFYIVN